jgi:branched-subunit amino acid permease
MELLETQDPERKKLIETSDQHKRELKKEVDAITGKTERMLTNALIIGGSLALTYFIISQLGGSKKKKKKNAEEETQVDEVATPSVFSQIGSKVIDQAALILLDIAREKLSEYLQYRKKSNENS